MIVTKDTIPIAVISHTYVELKELTVIVSELNKENT